MLANRQPTARPRLQPQPEPDNSATRADRAGVFPFPGFITLACHCPRCGHGWPHVGAIGKAGITCPACGYVDARFVVEDPRSHPFAHDGAWVDGVPQVVDALARGAELAAHERRN